MKRKDIHKYILLLLGAFLMINLFGCGKQKYKLNLPPGFESEKKSYAAGEEVSVSFSFIATDTDYYFYSDVDFERDFTDKDGFVFRFVMPERDVTFWVESRNSMVYSPEIEYTEEELKEKIDEDRMVFDCYTATVGTDGGDGYDEFVLYRWDETGSLLLAKYSKWEYDGGEESARVCKVPLSTLYDAIKVVHEYGMQNWKDGIAICGGFYSVKYLEGDEIIRVTSDDMPEDGAKAFGAVESVMNRAWSLYGPKYDEGSVGIIDDPEPVLESE